MSQVGWDRARFVFTEPQRNDLMDEIRECTIQLERMLAASNNAVTYRKEQKGQNACIAHEVYQTRRRAEELHNTLSSCCHCQQPVAHGAKLCMKRPAMDKGTLPELSFDLFLEQSQLGLCETVIRMSEETKASTVRFQLDPPGAKREQLLTDICSAVKDASIGRRRLEMLIDDNHKLWDLLSTEEATVKAYQTLSLHDCLQAFPRYAHKRWLPKQKAILAATLAHSLLQLHDSPWLRHDWGVDDIAFLERPGFKLDSRARLDLCRPYILTSILPISPTSAQTASIQFATSGSAPCVQALGYRLLELHLNKTLEEEMTGRNSSDMVGTALDALDEANDDGDLSTQYYNAISFCLLKRKPDFSDQRFREQYYEKVILPLEEVMNELADVTGLP